MRRFFALATTLAAVALSMLVFASVGYAASPATDCANAGGTYVANGPNSTCTFPGDPVGNSSNTKGGSETSGPGKSEPNSDTTTCTGVNNKPHSCP